SHEIDQDVMRLAQLGEVGIIGSFASRRSHGGNKTRTSGKIPVARKKVITTYDFAKTVSNTVLAGIGFHFHRDDHHFPSFPLNSEPSGESRISIEQRSRCGPVASPMENEMLD